MKRTISKRYKSYRQNMKARRVISRLNNKYSRKASYKKSRSKFKISKKRYNIGW